MSRSHKLESIVFALIGFVSSFNFATNSTLFSLFAQNLDFSSQQIGILLSIFTAGSMFGAPLLGRLVDRTGKRKAILIASLGGQAILNFLTPTINNFWPLTVMRFLLGICIVAQAPILNEFIVNLEDPQLREQSLILLNLARSIGFSVGCLASGVLMDLNAAWNFYFSTLLALGTIIPATMFIKKVDKANISSSEKPSPQKWFFEKRIVVHYLSAMLRATAIMGMLFFLPLFWQSNNQSATSSGTIIGLANFLQITFFPIASRVCSRSPQKAFSIALLGYSMSILPFYIFPFARAWAALLPQTILSVSYVFFYTGAIFFTQEIVPRQRHAEAMGWLETSINLGGAMGPVVFASFLALNENNFPRTILLFSVLPILALLLFTLAKSEQKAR